MAESYQIRTYFGTPIPPFNEETISMGSGAITLRFVVTGKIPSKKNSQQVKLVYDKAMASLKGSSMVSVKQAMAALYKVYIRFIGNPEYKVFLDANKAKMLEQMMHYSNAYKDKGLIFPLTRCSMQVKFYFKDLYNTDLSNKAETIQDLLVACHILEDDNYKILNPVTYMGKSFKDEITQTIALISITIPNNKID